MTRLRLTNCFRCGHVRSPFYPSNVSLTKAFLAEANDRRRTRTLIMEIAKLGFHQDCMQDIRPRITIMSPHRESSGAATFPREAFIYGRW